MIYFILAREYEVMKIGLTINWESLKHRWTSITTGCPAKVILFGTIDTLEADINLETKLHIQFENWHKTGEWFYYNESVLSEVRLLANFVSPKAGTESHPFRGSYIISKETALEIDKLLRQGGMLNTQIAEKLGVSPSTVGRVKNGLLYPQVTGRTKRRRVGIEGTRTISSR